MSTVTLHPDEQKWLEEYRRVLQDRFPGVVERMMIYGSRARGTATEDSDLDVLLIVREGDWWEKRRIAAPGYDLAIGTYAVPSIMIYTRAEWEDRRRTRAPFWQTVTRDGVPV